MPERAAKIVGATPTKRKSLDLRLNPCESGKPAQDNSEASTKECFSLSYIGVMRALLISARGVHTCEVKYQCAQFPVLSQSIPPPSRTHATGRCRPQLRRERSHRNMLRTKLEEQPHS